MNRKCNIRANSKKNRSTWIRKQIMIRDKTLVGETYTRKRITGGAIGWLIGAHRMGKLPEVKKKKR